MVFLLNYPPPIIFIYLAIDDSVSESLACKMSRGSSQVVYVSWYNSSVGIGGQTSNRCNSWYVLDSISISESISVSKVSITVSFTLSNVVTIWPSSVSSISDMGDRGDSDVLEDWSSLGSKMGSGGGSNSWGISWDLGSIGVGGKSSNRNDWSSSGNVDGWVGFAFGFTLANKVSGIWVSSISDMANQSGMESWGSSGSKMGSGGGSYGWGISWYNSSVSIGGESSNRGNWGSSWDENISIGISFTLANVVSIWPSTVSNISVSGNSDILKDWSSLGSKMCSSGGSYSWGISWYLGSVGVGGESTNSNNWGSSENVDGCVSITFSCWSSRCYCQEGKE